MMRWIYTIAGVLTGLAAMALSWWSILEVGIKLGIPLALAVGLSSVFDLAALVMVGLCECYASSATAGSGVGPRASLLLMLAGSVYLNVRHAQMSGAGVTGAIAYSAPAVVAVLLVELHLRFANHLTRQELGRVAPALPVLGAWAVALYPTRALRVIRTVVAARLDAIAAEVAPPPIRASAAIGPYPRPHEFGEWPDEAEFDDMLKNAEPAELVDGPNASQTPCEVNSEPENATKTPVEVNSEPQPESVPEPATSTEGWAAPRPAPQPPGAIRAGTVTIPEPGTLTTARPWTPEPGA